MQPGLRRSDGTEWRINPGRFVDPERLNNAGSLNADDGESWDSTYLWKVCRNLGLWAEALSEDLKSELQGSAEAPVLFVPHWGFRHVLNTTLIIKNKMQHPVGSWTDCRRHSDWLLLVSPADQSELRFTDMAGDERRKRGRSGLL